MRIHKHILRFDFTRAAMAAFVCLSMAGSAGAGTVYSWQTDGGTFAYTDDRKRIPERYRDQVKSRSMKQLSNYKRFTASSMAAEGDHAKRLNDRLEHLRDGGAVAMVAPGPNGQMTSAAILVRASGGRRGTGTQVSVPLTGSGGVISTESVRIRPDSVLGEGGGMATQHITVVRQNGKVIAVSRSNPNHSGLDSPPLSEVLD